MNNNVHEKYMEEAILEAKKALNDNEIPIGAVIVNEDGIIIGRGHNDREKNQNVLGHAEINAIIDAQKFSKNWKLKNCSIYVTMEPCLMCYGTIVQSRISKIYYGTKESDIKKNGFSNFIESSIDIEGNILENESTELMKKFFENLRNKNS